MNKVLRGALTLLTLLLLVSTSRGESGAPESEDPELRFNIQMTAALNNDPKAQFQVAEMYESGTGTPQNLRMAYIWYTKSANQGYEPAAQKLANWEREKQDAESRARAEEQKRRQAEAEAAAARTARAEELKRKQQAEAEAAAKTAQASETVPVIKEKQNDVAVPKDKPKGATEKGPVEFKTNPCKTPTAKFTSTCQ